MFLSRLFNKPKCFRVKYPAKYISGIFNKIDEYDGSPDFSPNNPIFFMELNHVPLYIAERGNKVALIDSKFYHNKSIEFNN